MYCDGSKAIRGASLIAKVDERLNRMLRLVILGFLVSKSYNRFGVILVIFPRLIKEDNQSPFYWLTNGPCEIGIFQKLPTWIKHLCKLSFPIKLRITVHN